MILHCHRKIILSYLILMVMISLTRRGHFIFDTGAIIYDTTFFIIKLLKNHEFDMTDSGHGTGWIAWVWFLRPHIVCFFVKMARRWYSLNNYLDQ